MKTLTFTVTGMTCTSCSGIIENCIDHALISNVKASHLDNTVSVTVDDHIDKGDVSELLKPLLTNIGFTLEEKTKSITWQVISHLLQGMLGITAGASLMTLMMLGIQLSRPLLFVVSGASGLLTLVLGKETYINTLKKLFNTKSLTMDSLFSVSTLIALGVSISSLFVNWLPMMFDAGLMIFGFRHIGKAIEKSTKHRLMQSISFRNNLSKTYLVEGTDRLTSKKSPQSLEIDDIILLKPGQRIPVDAVLVSDTASINNVDETGSTFPEIKMAGATLLAGMIVTGSINIRIKVTAIESDSHLAEKDRVVIEAQAERAKFEETAKKLLNYFVPAVFITAAVFGVVAGFLLSPALGINSAVTVLVAACPCILGFIIPLSVKIGMTKALKRGVEFKNGKELQRAANINTVVFDLNGTLTKGKPEVSDLQLTTTDTSEKECLTLLSALESESDHPIARAITQYCQDKLKGHTVEAPITESKEISSRGIKASINGDEYVLGNSKMLDGISFDQSSDNQADHVIYLTKNSQVIARLKINDPLREDAHSLINKLKKQGKQIHLCTGASEACASRYARKLGIPEDNTKANCRPLSDNTKTAYITSLKEQDRKVAMVGDAGNDAAAIAQSDFGIAVQSTSAHRASQAQAGAVIRNQSLAPVLTAFAVAEQTVSNIKQSLGFSLLYNMSVVLLTGGLLVGLGFMINPAIGVGLMILQSSLVLLNAYRFKNKKLPELETEHRNEQQQAVEEEVQQRKTQAPNFQLLNGLRKTKDHDWAISKPVVSDLRDIYGAEPPGLRM